MKNNQAVKAQSGLSTDYLAWKVMTQKRREKEYKRDMEYNLRPRLRSDAHH